MKTIYLCGPMEYAKDMGIAWRREFAKELSKLGYKCIIPNDEEENIKKKYDFSINTKNEDLDKYIKVIREFIALDLDFVKNSDYLICNWEGEVSAGTIHEVGYGYQLNKPCYLVTSKSLQLVPGWFLACFTKCFKSLNELIEFLKEKENEQK